MKVVFFDRDGVINKDTHYVYKINEFQFTESIFEICTHITNLGYKIIVITNQSGIDRGYFSDSEFNILNDWMVDKFYDNNIEILDVFYCPHLPDANCDCRKPKPGLINTAKSKYSIDHKNSWFIGDKEDDIKAANSANIFNTILVNNGNNKQHSSNASYVINSIKHSKSIIK